MNKLLILGLSMGLISCTNVKTPTNHKEVKNQDTLITKYVNHLSAVSGKEKEFTIRLINTIKSYQDKMLDTTVITICRIDNDEILDTIKTRIYEASDTIRVNYTWTKNNQLLWEEQFKNPCYLFGQSTFYDYPKLNKWEHFTAGIYYASPDIYKIEDLKHLFESAIELGMSEFKDAGIIIDKEFYKQYIYSFSGNIIVWGNPEWRGVGYIWYEPLKRFVKYHIG